MKPIHRTVLQMREQEKTYAEICQETGLAKSTVSLIVRKHFPAFKNDKIKAKKFREHCQSDDFKRLQAVRHAAAVRVYKLEHDLLRDSYLEAMRQFPDQGFLHYISGLYEGEGRHASTEVEFSNSNSKLIKAFLKFLREAICFPEEGIWLRLVLHSSMDRDKCVSHWTKICKKDMSAVNCYDERPQAKVYKHKPDYYGTLTIRVRKPNGLKSALKEYAY